MSKHYNLLEAKEKIKKFYYANQESIWNDRFNLFLRGLHGLGKTAIVRQAAEEINHDTGKDIKVHIIRLSQYEDISQLTGKNTIFLKMKDLSGAEIEVNEKYVDIYHKMGYIPIPGSEEMRYTIPDIIKNIKEGDILFFDDYGRQLQHFNNSVMEIINEGEYLSWKLPKGVVTILSGNPDDGEYQVTENDSAQKDRSETLDVCFDSKVWALYAEKEKIEDVYIGFVYNNESLFNKQYDNTEVETTIETYSPRKWTKLFKFLSTVYKDKIHENINNIHSDGYLFVREQISELVSYLNDSFSKVCKSSELLDLEKTDDNINELIDNNVKIHQTVKPYISFRLINYLFANKETLFKNEEYAKKLADRVVFILKNPHFEKDIKNNFIMSIAKDKTFDKIYMHFNEIMK